MKGLLSAKILKDTMVQNVASENAVCYGVQSTRRRGKVADVGQQHFVHPGNQRDVHVENISQLGTLLRRKGRVDRNLRYSPDTQFGKDTGSQARGVAARV